MKSTAQFKVGDKLVEPGSIYMIFKIKKVRNDAGVLERTIFFKPFFEENNQTQLVCSFPEKNITETDLRKVKSKKVLHECLLDLKKLAKFIIPTNVDDLKIGLNLNSLEETFKVLKLLIQEKKFSETFPKIKRDLMATAIESIAQEFAIINNVSLNSARVKVAKIT